MVVLNGHFDGKHLIVDDPLPDQLPRNTPLRVTVSPLEPDASEALAQLVALAKPLGKPRDFAAQHEHYVKGTPKR